jgi:Acyl-CoA carboxylase epsilon subunit
VSQQEETATPGPTRPPLRIVKGDPTPEEIAALVAVLARMGSGAAPEPPPRRSEWASHHRRMRSVLNPGPGAWRASALPR